MDSGAFKNLGRDILVAGIVVGVVCGLVAGGLVWLFVG